MIDEKDVVEGNRAATEVGEDKEIDAVDSAEENNADQTEIEESESAPVQIFQPEENVEDNSTAVKKEPETTE